MSTHNICFPIKYHCFFAEKAPYLKLCTTSALQPYLHVPHAHTIHRSPKGHPAGPKKVLFTIKNLQVPEIW